MKAERLREEQMAAERESARRRLTREMTPRHSTGGLQETMDDGQEDDSSSEDGHVDLSFGHDASFTRLESQLQEAQAALEAQKESGGADRIRDPNPNPNHNPNSTPNTNCRCR